MEPKVKIDRTLDPIEGIGAEFSEERKGKVIEAFTPIMAAITDVSSSPEIRSKAYKRSDSIFIGLCNRYQKSAPIEFDDPKYSADSRYANHVVDIFKTLEAQWPDSINAVMSLCSSSVKGLIDAKQRLYPVDVARLKEITGEVAKRNNGRFFFSGLTKLKAAELNEIYNEKWSDQMPLFVLSVLDGIDEIKRVFSEWSEDKYFNLFETSVNKNLFGAVVMDLFQDHHIYVSPPSFTKKSTEQEITKYKVLAEKFKLFRERFLKSTKSYYKIPSYNFRPLQHGTSANIAGLETRFVIFVEQIENLFLENSRFSLVDVRLYEQTICMYALFAVYSSLEFGRFRDEETKFFETRKKYGGPNIPLIATKPMSYYLAESDFFSAEFTKSTRYGSRVKVLIDEISKEMDGGA